MEEGEIPLHSNTLCLSLPSTGLIRGGGGEEGGGEEGGEERRRGGGGSPLLQEFKAAPIAWI